MTESTDFTTEAVYVIFDGPPSHTSGRFLEVETDDGRSVNTGEWELCPARYSFGEVWRLGPFVDARAMTQPIPTVTTEGTPTLRDYAKVIEWLWQERHNQMHPAGVHVSDFPPGLYDVFDDALHRAALGRVADRMAERYCACGASLGFPRDNEDTCGDCLSESPFDTREESEGLR